MEHGRAASGRGHLATLAREPRPTGSAADRAAQDHAARVLRDAGFHVSVQPFAYSALPGRYGTPVGGAFVLVTALLSAGFGLADLSFAAAASLATGVLLTGAYVSAMLGDAVLVLPWLRAEANNLAATRGSAAPGVWLVAHSDTKSQPVPSLARMAGVAMLAIGVSLAVVAVALQLMALPHRMAWWSSVACVVLGAVPVLCSVVGSRSPGAVDNASGMAAVLDAAVRVRPEVAFGVLISSGEELGLAGARAFARTKSADGSNGIAINCDGVDDRGTTMLLYSGRLPSTLVETLRGATPGALRVRRIPLGMLTDSMAFAERGWPAVTVSRGSLGTLRRVHTSSDSLANLRGDGLDDVSTLLVRAVEALA